MDKITNAEYWTECENLAKQIADECAENGTDRYDALNEAVDSHQWVIYAFYNLQILEHCSNREEYFDSNGAMEKVESLSQVLSLCAAWAFSADVGSKFPTTEDK